MQRPNPVVFVMLDTLGNFTICRLSDKMNPIFIKEIKRIKKETGIKPNPKELFSPEKLYTVKRQFRQGERFYPSHKWKDFILHVKHPTYGKKKPKGNEQKKALLVL